MTSEQNEWCVFLFNQKYGVSVLETGLTENEAKRAVQQQIDQGEKNVQLLSHGDFAKLFGQPPKVK